MGPHKSFKQLIVCQKAAGAGAKAKPGLKAQEKSSKVKKKPMLLVKAPGGAPASSLLMQLTVKRLQKQMQ